MLYQKGEKKRNEKTKGQKKILEMMGRSLLPPTREIIFLFLEGSAIPEVHQNPGSEDWVCKPPGQTLLFSSSAPNRGLESPVCQLWCGIACIWQMQKAMASEAGIFSLRKRFTGGRSRAPWAHLLPVPFPPTKETAPAFPGLWDALLSPTWPPRYLCNWYPTLNFLCFFVC